MRTSMLTEDSFASDDLEPPPRRWVGRGYAWRVLVDRQRTGPMPGVDVDVIKRHCRRAIRQMFLRDAAMLAVIAIAGCLAPWATIVVLGLIATVVALTGRVKITSPFTIAAALGISLAIISGKPRGSDNFGYPLLAIGLCFVIFTIDSFWAIRRMRAVLREPLSAADDDSPAVAGDPEFEEVDMNGTKLSDSFLNFRAKEQGPAPSRGKSKALYDKDGILGAGTPLRPVTFTIAVNKPQKGEQIIPFSASELLEWIASHIESQGTVNRAPDGYAHRHVLVNGKRVPLDIPGPRHNRDRSSGSFSGSEFEAFTYGLPELDVSDVIATPVPRPTYRPFWWIVVRYLLASLAGRGSDSQLGSGDRTAATTPSESPSAFPARRYVKACTGTWDGELVTSVYVGAALQAHYLRLIVRPYVLAPIVPHLAELEYLATRNPFVHIWLAASGTGRACLNIAVAAHNLSLRRNSKGSVTSGRPRAGSMRERYALSYPANSHQIEDASRILQVIEMKIFKVTGEYLDSHMVDTEEYDRQIQVFAENSMVIFGGENSGNFSVGNNNTQQNSGGGSAGGQGNGK
jgi:hypothetical protein